MRIIFLAACFGIPVVVAIFAMLWHIYKYGDVGFLPQKPSMSLFQTSEETFSPGNLKRFIQAEGERKANRAAGVPPLTRSSQ